MVQQPTVGIVSVGTYSPKKFITSKEIAEISGLPEEVIRDKMGIHRKFIGDENDHPNEMGIQAALDCLARANFPPEEIDVVLCTTEEWKEYLLWTAGIHLAYEIGARRAWALDVHMRCATTVNAMKLAKDMMIADPEINTVLIAGGYKVCDFINLKNARTSFMWNIGAGGGAMLLRKNWARNRVLGTHFIVDGSMIKHVIIPASGTVQPPSDAARTQGLFYFDLVEPEAMKNRLNAVSMDNWLKCVDEALRKSGTKPDGSPYTRADIGFANILLIKPSAHREMLERLGLREDQSVYLSEYGHTGEQDAMFSIVEGLKQGRLKDGDLMVIVAAGIGYVWAAGVVQWGTGYRDQGTG
ncbi:MAG: 3-oxoacyl-ACP synthase, partial [Anaerolineae bacterium]|nr:3-oxoacyl-ACP synthase [Anaerolineae bacterium]